MVVPAKRLSYSRSRKRRFQKEILKPVKLVGCKNCKALTLPHRVCIECGFYNGKKYIDDKSAKSKKNKSSTK
ncbi:MAG: 50S ribosomal protein L32 [Candidatus Parcubacteria bacterium]|nr:MAG: 50S ribosomal protein L32 [Candidatus Parcubacteria bacterium]